MFASRLALTKTECKKLVLRLRPPAMTLDAEKGKIDLQESKTKEELQQRVTQSFDSLRSRMNESLDLCKAKIIELIPKKPLSDDAEAQRSYEEELKKFEILFGFVKEFLKAFNNFFAKLMVKITEFYNQLWEDSKKGINVQKRVKTFNEDLKKQYDRMVEDLKFFI